eukprot:TRINITY_DN10523_c0_g2_i1.p1 TRINITY_DN10523_c0_g2~~TRINITY_DN10523_c0_g2_i1.p1  ORF type:complete len:356 (+),score=85.29 TRINITY_DN10523_c0_g2_i1:249-1316(+)
MLRVVKPKTRKARRALDLRAPKLHENTKKLVLLHGTTNSAVVKGVLSDLHALKRANGKAVKLNHKNDGIRPFEAGGETSLEFLSQKTDCSLFGFASHTKKRPHNLILGRMFDYHLLDMVELGVDKHVSIKEMGPGGKYAPQLGSKPCIVFLGADFEAKPELLQLKSILLDFFRGEVVETLNLAGLDRVFICMALEGKVWLRHCAVRLKKSGTSVPRIELVAVGPSLDFTLRRHRVPGEELAKAAMKAPKSGGEKKKVKNVSTDMLEGKIGRIYMPKQEIDQMALKKMKGLKRERRDKASARSGESGSSGKRERDEAGEGKRKGDSPGLANGARASSQQQTKRHRREEKRREGDAA